MTLQNTQERRPKKIDLNLLPPEYRPPKKSYLGPILYTLVFVLACVMAALIVIKSGVNSDIKSLNTDLANLQQQMNTLMANKNEADPIKAQISAAQSQLSKTQADYDYFINNHTIWSQIITEINDLIPGKKVTLTSITASAGNVVIMSGNSSKKINAYNYIVSLEDSGLFGKINFNFGDCAQENSCDFDIQAPLAASNQTEGGAR